MSDQNAPRSQSDAMDPARANALLVSLGLNRQVSPGDALPPFFHHLYFWDAQPPALLGRDGHPRLGTGLVPDMSLPRRMWAGGRLRFASPLCAGRPAERVSRVASAQRKTGRTGPLAFVTLSHEVWQDGVLCVSEAAKFV